MRVSASTVTLACAGCLSGTAAFQASLFQGAPLQRARAAAAVRDGASTATTTADASARTQRTACRGSNGGGGSSVGTRTAVVMDGGGGVSRQDFFKQAGLSLAALAVGGATGAAPAKAQAGSAVEVMRLRFGDKLRRAAKMLDELQDDISNSDWDLVTTYPNAFRTLVPVFTKYTDAAFPTDDPVDTTSRVALRYEVGRFYGAVERLKRAAEQQNSKEAQSAFAAMSVAYDRYLKAGNLYDGYDSVTSTEGFYADVSNSSLKYVPPSKDPPKIKDNVLLVAGPDKGKTGFMIGVEGGSLSATKAIVKLETSSALGMREIKVVPLDYVAKTLDQQGMFNSKTMKKMRPSS
ncbi:unnamed protein product [Ectocarpus sp. 6 AP-2014]